MRFPTLALLTSLALAAAAHGTGMAQDTPALRLELRVVHEQSLVPGATAKTPLDERSERTVELVLGPRSFRVTDDGRVEVYDFERDVAMAVDASGKTYRERSLLGEIDQRSAELANRQKIGEIAGAAGMKELPTQVENEISLGCCDDPKSSLARSEREGAIEWSAGDEVVTRCELAEQEIPAELRGTFARALFYRCHLHPSVRTALADLGRAPALLAFRYRDMATVHRVEWRLVRAAEVETRDATQLERSFDTLDPLERALARAHAALASGAATVAPLLEAAGHAQDDGHPVDAYLLLLEASLQQEDCCADRMQALLADRDAREAVGAMWNALDPKSGKDQATRFGSVDADALHHRYVLDIFRANELAGQDRTSAQQMLLGVLEENPLITGVYKDLGDLYRDQWDMARAWSCWTMAERIDAKHSLLERVRGLEKELRERFADLL